MNNQRLLFTGASGFVGREIGTDLNKLYEVVTLGGSKQDMYNIDLSNQIPEFSNSFDIVFHAAGKAHSQPKNDFEKELFFKVNLTGTINLCSALEKCGVPKNFIFISTVAVYGCDYGENIKEDYPLNGVTPYALSKIHAEKYLIEWCNKNNVILSILRPSLIAGQNAPGNLGAMVKGIKSGKYLSIGKANAQKSVLMVQDLANIIPHLIDVGGIYNICDDSHPSFAELENMISKQLSKSNPIKIPYFVAVVLAYIGDILGQKSPINTYKLNKIRYSLTFSNEKIKNNTKWRPLNVLENYKV